MQQQGDLCASLMLSSAQKVLVLGQRVFHERRGYGNVCMVDHTLEKCYHIQYDNGEQHSYNHVQADSKFTLVETATQAESEEEATGCETKTLRITIHTAIGLAAMDSDPYGCTMHPK